jgi:hypothetical protein
VSTASEFANARRQSRAFSGCVCADLHIRRMHSRIGSTNRAHPTSRRARRCRPDACRMSARSGMCTTVPHNARRRARARATARPRRAHSERRVRARARWQYRVRVRIARRKSARRVTKNARGCLTLRTK